MKAPQRPQQACGALVLLAYHGDISGQRAGVQQFGQQFQQPRLEPQSALQQEADYPGMGTPRAWVSISQSHNAIVWQRGSQPAVTKRKRPAAGAATVAAHTGGRSMAGAEGQADTEMDVGRTDRHAKCTCQAVWRSLPPIAKQCLVHMLLHRPVAEGSCCSPLSDKT